MKHPTACLQCRATKRKCTQNPTDSRTACLACQSRKIECSKPWNGPRLQPITPWRTQGERPLAPLTTLPPSTIDLQPASSKDICEFIRLYFHFIHDRPHSLFHERTLWDEIRDGSLPECLLVAICAMGCRLSPHASHRNLAAIFTSRSKSLLAQQLENICIPNVQACILLANIYAAEQDNGLEALYFGSYPCHTICSPLIKV